MRVRITALRAPWPAGAAVGSIVEIQGDALPGPFVGKCEPAPPGAGATHVYEPPRPTDPADPGDLVEGLLGSATPATPDALAARREELRVRLLSIDLAAAERRLEQAKARREASPADVPPVAPPGVGSSDAAVQRLRAHEADAAEFNAARSNLRSLREEAAAISNELAYLTTMIEAESRLEATRTAAQAAEEEAASCKDAFAKAGAAVGRIEALIESEERAYAAARDEGGARVLEAIKSGNAAVTVEAASRDKVATFEVAKRGAEQDLQAAHSALEQAEQRRREAWQQVRLAEATIAERAFRQAEREYVEALFRVTIAKSVARDPFSAADPRGEATARARRVIERVGT